MIVVYSFISLPDERITTTVVKLVRQIQRAYSILKPRGLDLEFVRGDPGDVRDDTVEEGREEEKEAANTEDGQEPARISQQAQRVRFLDTLEQSRDALTCLRQLDSARDVGLYRVVMAFL